MKGYYAEVVGASERSKCPALCWAFCDRQSSRRGVLGLLLADVEHPGVTIMTLMSLMLARCINVHRRKALKKGRQGASYIATILPLDEALLSWWP